nr:protein DETOXIFICATION 12-like [Ipomoea batatas]
MEEGLLLKKREEESCGGGERRRWAAVWVEVKRLGYLAGPMVAVTLSQYLLQVISVMMVGHLGELSLSSTSIAISIAGVTGFSFLVSSTYTFSDFNKLLVGLLILLGRYVFLDICMLPCMVVQAQKPH